MYIASIRRYKGGFNLQKMKAFDTEKDAIQYLLGLEERKKLLNYEDWQWMRSFAVVYELKHGLKPKKIKY